MTMTNTCLHVMGISSKSNLTDGCTFQMYISSKSNVSLHHFSLWKVHGSFYKEICLFVLLVSLINHVLFLFAQLINKTNVRVL